MICTFQSNEDKFYTWEEIAKIKGMFQADKNDGGQSWDHNYFISDGMKILLQYSAPAFTLQGNLLSPNNFSNNLFRKVTGKLTIEFQ